MSDHSVALDLAETDDLFLWAKEQVAKPLLEAMERREKTKAKVGGRPRMESASRIDPFLFMAEYLVWKATPPAWRPETWPSTERAFCKAYDAPITALLWYRRLVGFDTLVKRARKFQPGSHERIADARNVAHLMVTRQPELDPRFADARWLAETAKIEGLHHTSPMVQIQNNTQMVAPMLNAAEAKSFIADTLEYFSGKGRLLPEGARFAELDATRSHHVVSPEGQAATGSRLDPEK